MDNETAALIANAQRLSKWAAEQVEATDKLIALAEIRPPSPADQLSNLRMQRELLVRLSQRESMIEWALESRKAPIWFRIWRRLRKRSKE